MKVTKNNNPDSEFIDLKIRLIPRSSREVIVGREGDVYRVKVTVPPVEGKANEALISLLAKRLGRPKGEIVIKAGKNSRSKVVRVQGLTKKDVTELLG